MTRITTLDLPAFRRATIGFDRMFNSLNEVSRINTSNFPPYNIRKIGGCDTDWQIEIALAGFSKSDIDIEVQDSILTITAKKDDKLKDDLIHQGIASRNVVRKFTLSEYIKVDSADFKDGVLTIKVYEELPEEKKAKTIKIK